MLRTLLISLLAFFTGVALVLAFNTAASVPHATQVAAPRAASKPPPANDTPPNGAAASDDIAQPNDTNWPEQAPSPEQVIYAQPRLMQRTLAAMTARSAGGPNLYLIAFAGDGGENVFRNEAEYAARLFSSRYGKRTHVVVLENNSATLSTRPLASWSNLEIALRGIARVMDPSQDIVMFYLTSHGTEDHTLLVDMDPLPLDQIGVTDLAQILHEQSFKWKVVVVNACYSGGFVPPLKGPGTMVITAARSNRSSFGCGSDSDITYFGRAFLVDGLNHSDSFVEAFRHAKDDVSRWEKRDGFMPSEPQIDVGRGIEKQLRLWRTGVPPGRSMPFAAASQTMPASTSTATTP